MYINFDCIIPSPLNIPRARETYTRLTPIVGSSLVLINLALLYTQEVMITSIVEMTRQINIMVETLPPDMVYMYVAEQSELIPQAKVRIAEDIWEFLTLSINYFRSQPFIANLIVYANSQNMYVRANDVMDDVSQPYINVNVKPRF